MEDGVVVFLGTWTAAGNPYVVTGDLYVNSVNLLTIEPGVEVRFYGDITFMYMVLYCRRNRE